MSILAKLSRLVVNAGYQTERLGSNCLLVKRNCSRESNGSDDDKPITEFRVLNIMSSAPERNEKVIREVKKDVTELKYMEDHEWANVWVGPKSFDPYMVPIPVKQGYVQNENVPDKFCNLELMKIPNFLHLTFPAIEKHCKALKKFCTKWPAGLSKSEDINQHFPITIISSDYCHSSPSIRHPLSRIISLEININSLKLNKNSKDKFLRLVGKRYNPKTKNITLTVDNCPLKKQNFDYAMYILTALCFESWKREDWEDLKSLEDLYEYCFELRKSKSNMKAYFDYTGKHCPSFGKLDMILEKYIGNNKESQNIHSLKQEVLHLLKLPKFA